MYYLNLDENNYLLSVMVVGSGTEANIDLNDYDLSGLRLNAYKWENNALIFDEARYNALVAQQEAEEQNHISYAQRFEEVQRTLEIILSGDTE